jgi:peptide-methionine (S)-S-oxide reductase
MHRGLAAAALKMGYTSYSDGGMTMGSKIDPFSFPDPEPGSPIEPASGGPRSIVLGGGCFWCTEAVYKQLEGVTSVRPGYAGDTKDTADYKAVSSGRTDHAEVIEVVYDPARIGLGQILKIFFSIAHDPTQKDRQGADVGRQYRSVIFYRDDSQRKVAEAYIAQLGRIGAFDEPIVTELEPLEAFYEAEDYHHDYAARNPNQPYIRGVSAPKVAKLKKVHADMLKPGGVA